MQIIHNHFETLSSTNDWAKEKIASFDKEAITLISAGEQTKGRGQRSKQWISPPHFNIYASFCFFVSLEEDPFLYTRKMSLIVLEVLKKWGIGGRIKWPNDIFVNGKKIAGILTESVEVLGKRGVIVGLGLNVNMGEKERELIDQPATSMFLETGEKVDLNEVLDELKLKVIHIRNNG